MARDPYQDPTEEDELAASGATEWFSESLAEQRGKDAQLKANLGQDARALKSRNRRLIEDMMDLPADIDPEEPILDLFASERASARKKNSDLSSIMGDLEEGRAAEKSLLKDLFGK